MKAFFIGLVTLIIVIIMGTIGTLLYPFFIVLGLLFRVILSFLLFIFAIWLLGKLILFIWEKLFKEQKGKIEQ